MTLSVSTSRLRSTVAALAVVAISWAIAGPAVAPDAGNGLTSAVTAAVDPTLNGITGTAHILVQGARATEATIADLGGKVTHDLPIVGGYSATIPADKLPQLARTPGVKTIVRDTHMAVMAAPVGYDASAQNPPNVYQQVVGADQLRADGNDGHGVTVAVLDTGISSMADTSSRLVSVQTDALGHRANCVNFAGDGTCTDLFGHGTYIGGLVAGTGAASGGEYAGVAPGAKLLSVKVAGADGSSDVSTVIAALQWVITFKNTYNIKVLNLSLGTDGTQSYQLSPLDFAVEKAWNAGITTLVSASNLGPGASTVDKPADDPFVITVGAVDDNGTTALSDDSVPFWSARGPTAADGLAKPDVTAPGVGLVSLAAPGASLTVNRPPAMAAPYRQAAGTSFSTAVVSGLVADILSAHPTWSPNRVKFALMNTAQSDAGDDPMAVGAGLVDGNAALSAPSGVANQNVGPSTGLGSLQADRGSASVQVNGAGGATVVNGEITAQLTPWNFLAMLAANFNGTSWYGTSWYGTSWYGTSWYGTSWYGTSWYGTSWYGTSWYGTSWYGTSWYGYWA
jgi:serine protease AprX